MGLNIRNRQSGKQRCQDKNELSIRQGGIHTENFGINLVKLPVAPLLGSFPAEHGANSVKFAHRVLGIQFVLNIGPHNRCRCFRAQGQEIPFSIGKGIHFLFHNIGIFPDTPGKQLGALHNRNADFFKAKVLQKLNGRLFNLLPKFHFSRQDIFKTSD